ncbi:hypothetical protein J4U01_gp055 [Mycobacterium phage Kumao]|uniref:Uncharacterized protein n=1 Tax=Mycobacterium phage Kumao TaxID=2041344 RepID=A0A2D1GPX5_9CAUD|nr:hypothetical protein J4U01_gp055 [Mycobacterium phage Kumao]ATN94018.1 hypothetical protein SEA_KUMAO_55 [Mycobacterium phage Kumao]
MLPHIYRAPGLPTKLPDTPVVRDKKGKRVYGGQTSRIGKLTNVMRRHHREELARRGR